MFSTSPMADGIDEARTTCIPIVWTNRMRPNPLHKVEHVGRYADEMAGARYHESAPALPRAIPLTLILPTIRPSAAVRASATICWPVEENREEINEPFHKSTSEKAAQN